MRFEIRHPSHREEASTENDLVVFGRDVSCDVVIKNPRCSRRHASLRVVPGGLRLLDLGSANGVYVLGQKVEDAIIQEGDVFSLGDVFVRVLPEEVPVTLSLSQAEATLLQSPSMPVPPPVKRPPAAPPPAPGSPAPEIPGSPRLLAPRVLGVCSVSVGVALIVGPLALGPHIGVLALALPALGLASATAGLGRLASRRWARSIHYAVFTIWILACLMAPYGVIGLAYQIRGEDHPETDSFFAVVIALAGSLAVIALIVAAFLARIYVPAPLPL